MLTRSAQIMALAGCVVALGCGDEGGGGSASILMQLDPQSCAFDEADLRLACQSTAIVIVQDQVGTQIAADCATLSPGPLADTAGLIQGALDLGSLPSDTALTISLAVYSGVIQPCPQTTISSNPFLFGTTRLLTLSSADSPIALTLQCENTGAPVPVPPSGECSECEGARSLCEFNNGLSDCNSLILNCEDNCGDPGNFESCFTTCELLDSFCTSSDETRVNLNCGQNPVSCLQHCEGLGPNENCGELCGEAAQKCNAYQAIQNQCDSAYQSCMVQCGGEGTSCLTATPGT